MGSKFYLKKYDFIYNLKHYFKEVVIMSINKHEHNKKIKATVIINPASRSGLKVYQKLTNCVDNYFYHDDQIFILIP